MKKKKRLMALIIITISALLCTSVWVLARRSCTLRCTPAPSAEMPYSDEEAAYRAAALSYFVYGCEQCEPQSGTVAEILESSRMGIIEENFGVVRTEADDPASAVIDTAEFIRGHIGEFRLLTALKSEKSGFYGAVFCDDAKKCVWIAYSGSITFRDALAAAGLAVSPVLTRQEKSAFALYETALQCAEITRDGCSLVLTGHSLGGAFAAMIARAGGARAVTVNGADGLALDKMNAILRENAGGANITNYLTSPEKGRNTLYDLVQRLMFLGSYDAVDLRLCRASSAAADTHSVFSIVDF